MKRRAALVICMIAIFCSTICADVVRRDNGAVIPGTEGITPGPGVDLSDLDLSFAALNNRNLTGGFFTASNLTSATFKSSLLTATDFTAANLSQADLDRATLTNTIFTNAIITGSILNGATGKSFTKEQLYATGSYQSKNLQGVQLGLNNLEAWDFSGQDLTNSRLSHLVDANLQGANLTNAAIGVNAVTNANFADAVIQGLNLSGSAGFTETQLYSTASYQAQNLGAIGLNGQTLSGWQLQG